MNVRGRLVFPALDSLVASAVRRFPRVTVCPALGAGCGVLGVSHSDAEESFLHTLRAAHLKYCTSH